MAIINFSKGDKLKSLLAESGWYPLEISEVTGPVASSSGKSVSFFVDFKVTDGDLQDKEFKIAYNTGTKNFSVLGGQQFQPHTDLIALAAAALNCDRAAVPDTFDTDSLKGKKVDGKVEKGIHDGVPGNTIIGFLPAGQGQNQKAPF